MDRKQFTPSNRCHVDQNQCAAVRRLGVNYFEVYNTSFKNGPKIEASHDELADLFRQIKAGIKSNFAGELKITPVDIEAYPEGGYQLFRADTPQWNWVWLSANETTRFYEYAANGRFDDLLAGRVTGEIVASAQPVLV